MPKRKRGSPPPAAAGPSRAAAFLAAVERRAPHVAVALVAIATLRIVATYTVFNHTIDEPAHLACGMEWLARGVYQYEHQHPPLARVATAIGPYLAGSRGYAKPSMWNEGVGILYGGNQYDRTLALARLGILPFFWVACAAVYLWTRRALGRLEAAGATLLFSFLPPVLAHAGLATTDMALTAWLGASALAWSLWLETPDWRRGAILGATLGLSLLSKFSTIPYFPMFVIATAALGLAARRGVDWSPKRRAASLGVAALVLFLIAWAGYRFHTGPWPAPELASGIRQVLEHNEKGNPSYLLGQYGETGWWYYYFVVLAVKTPLPFLLLAVAGLGIVWRGRRLLGWPALAAAGLVTGVVVFASAFSRINIGVRHVLPVYVAAAVLAMFGARRLAAGSRWSRGAVAALLAWHCIGSALSHPDYLPYFNLLAGDRPERIVVDSDLDWGQDMKRLAARLRELGAREVAFDPFILAHYEAAHGFPKIRPLDPEGPRPGWNAVSLTILKLARLGLKGEHLDITLWPDLIPPRERVGKSVLLYWFPAPGR